MTRSPVTALMMAGGGSKRMRAAGCPLHKGLRSVLGVPLIERNLQRLLELDFSDIYVSVSAREEELVNWLDGRGRALVAAQRAMLEILLEETPLGTIGAAGLLPERIRDVVIVNVDNLSSLDLAKMADFHCRQQPAATIATHRHAVPIAYGALEVQGDRVVEYREKPIFHVSVSSGTYLLGRAAIERLRPGARRDAPELMNELLEAGETVLAYAHQEPWIDVNDEAALFQAESLLLSSRSQGEGPDCV